VHEGLIRTSQVPLAEINTRLMCNSKGAVKLKHVHASYPIPPKSDLLDTSCNNMDACAEPSLDNRGYQHVFPDPPSGSAPFTSPSCLGACLTWD
jgi:hypothetical protein